LNSFANIDSHEIGKQTTPSPDLDHEMQKRKLDKPRARNSTT